MRIKYYLLIIILLLSTSSYAQRQPRWCQQQGVVCSTDRAYGELFGTAHGERLVQSAVNQIENYLNTTCFGSAGRLRTHGRNLCGDYFLRRRLDRILFVSPLAQRQFHLPASGLRLVRDCEALTLHVSQQTLNTERGLSLFRHTLENIIPGIASEAELQFSEVRRLARVRQTQQQQFIPSGARYEGVVSWDIIGDISRAASQTSTPYQHTQTPLPARHMSYLPVPSAFPLAITLRTDHHLPTLAVNTTCLQGQTSPGTVALQRPEDLGFPPLSTNIQYPDARTRRCVEQTYRYFWEQHAYTWRETRLAIDLSDRQVALADIESNPDAIRWFAELDAGSQNINRNDADIWRPISPSALNDCGTIIASHTEIPLEMRYYYQTIRLRSAPQTTHPTTLLNDPSVRHRVQEIVNWCTQGDPCFCVQSKIMSAISSLLSDFPTDQVRSMREALDQTDANNDDHRSLLCQNEMNNLFGPIWRRLATQRTGR